jgi:hypothetical protein
MKIFHLILFVTLLIVLSFFISCKDSKKEDQEEIILDNELSEVFSKAAIDETNPGVWIYDYDADIPIKNREILQTSITSEEIIDFLNSHNENVFLEFSKHSGDTLFVKIKESTFLTQQMGSAGADGYLSLATYTLTEAENVNYVHFDFKEGDHAIPGTYSRQYYIDRNKERFQ